MDRQNNEYESGLPQFPGSTEPESNEPTTTHESDVGALRDELIALAESGDIKQSVKTIKKSNTEALERIKRDYMRKQTNEVNELVSNEILTKLTDVIHSLGAVDDATGMNEELTSNKLLKRDLKNIVGMITPYIPLIGLVCGGAIIGKYVFKSRMTNESTSESQSE